jgi:two-component system, NarL family, response regulator NreC
MTIKILLADDHQIVLDGLRSIFNTEPDFQIVGEVQDGRQILPMVKEKKPDVVILDIQLYELSGLEAARLLHVEFPGVRIIFLSMHLTSGYVIEALRAGALGYFLKKDNTKDLVKAVRSVAAGKIFLSPSISRAAMDEYMAMYKPGIPDPLDSLTARERQILNLISQGMTSLEVANYLGISKRTVDTHRSHIMEKLQLDSLADLMRYCAERGISFKQ